MTTKISTTYDTTAWQISNIQERTFSFTFLCLAANNLILSNIPSNTRNISAGPF